MVTHSDDTWHAECQPDPRIPKIRALNDRLRRELIGGQIFLTPGVQGLGEATVASSPTHRSGRDRGRNPAYDATTPDARASGSETDCLWLPPVAGFSGVLDRCFPWLPCGWVNRVPDHWTPVRQWRVNIFRLAPLADEKAGAARHHHRKTADRQRIPTKP